MGRKWTNLKFDISNPGEKVEEATSNPRDREEVFFEFLEEEFGLEDQENVRIAENVDLMFGRLSEEDLKEKMEKVFREFDFVNKAAAIFVTDSGHVGYGWYFTRGENGEVELEDYYKGYEGAEGHDVAGKISDENNIKISPEFYW